MAKLEEAIAAIRAGKRVKTPTGACEYGNLAELSCDIADNDMHYDAYDDVFEIVEPPPEPATDEEIVEWLGNYAFTTCNDGDTLVYDALKMVAEVIRTRKLPTP